MVAASQVDERCPNNPNIVYFRIRILPVMFLMTSFRLLDTDVLKNQYVSETILLGKKLKTKTNETESSLH